MSVPEGFAERLAPLPEPLRSLLDAELAAGNEIVEVFSGFPAPPVGLCVRLARPVTTRPRAPGAGVAFRDRGGSLPAGEFHDEQERFFLLEPPRPEPTDEPVRRPGAEAAGPSSSQPAPEADDAVRRFERSMVIDYGKWHDGVGYDLDALRAATPAERGRIEDLLVARGAAGWREVAALAALDSPRARDVLAKAARNGSSEVRVAVLEHAPDLLPEAQRTGILVAALEGADLYDGLSQALDAAAEFHPPAVVDALFRGALAREGSDAALMAALLMFVHGKADEPFDWSRRPFFLRFDTADRAEREAVFRELCAQVGADAGRYLAR